jgi:perosamine synthetase
LVRISKPLFSETDLDEITSTIRRTLSEGWLTTGSITEAFEKEVAHFVGTEHAVATNSCSTALTSILLALGIKAGDTVILPANTFAATANSIKNAGAVPFFVDCLPDTFNISPDEITARAPINTKAVIAVNIGGNPCDLDRLVEICKANDWFFVQDAAHSFGSLYQADLPASYGIASSFSFSATKVITSGEGGAVATDSAELYRRVKAIRDNGRLTTGPSDVMYQGSNFKMSNIHAAIGLSQMKHVRQFLGHRQDLADYYIANLPRWLVPQLIRPGNTSSNYAFICMVKPDSPVTRDELASFLSSKNIETSIYFKPLTDMSLFVSTKDPWVPVSKEIGERSIGFPIGNSTTLDEVKSVIEAIKFSTEEVRV